jgi:hypothetical protein
MIYWKEDDITLPAFWRLDMTNKPERNRTSKLEILSSGGRFLSQPTFETGFISCHSLFPHPDPTINPTLAERERLV